MYIYKICNTVNQKVYIGQTIESLDKRFKRHIGYNCRDNDTKFYRAIKKYGYDKFYIELLEEVENQSELNQKEIYYIEKYNSILEGYNTAKGGLGGDTLSNHPNLKNIKKKISKAHTGGNNPNATPIVCTNIETGIKMEYKSMSECQKDMGIPRHDIIRRRCIGQIKKLYRDKYTFSYLEGQTTIERVALD